MMIDMAFRRDFTSPSLYELLDQRSARQRNDRRRRLALQAHQDVDFHAELTRHFHLKLTHPLA